jgi:hypothetical protein
MILVNFNSLRKLLFGSVLLFLIASITPLFVPTVKASPSTWSIQTVDSSASVGVDTSIAVDSNGIPHISYYDAYWGNLKYAKWNGSGWDIAAPLDNGDGDDVGTGSSIGIDSNDYPHISYMDYTNSNLKYAMWNGTAWSVETIHKVASALDETSIALDSADHPHISYIRGDPAWWLSYGVWGGMNWSFVSIDTSCVAMYPSIAVDSLDRPHISYYDYTNRDLKYARWTGSIWINETIDSDGDVGVTPSIALDSDDNPHISYRDATNADLKYARWNGTAWNIETVDSNGNVGEYTSIALDSNDYPHISYKDGLNDDLKYARWTGSVWAIESVDTANAVGAYCSIALDSGDHPHISYWDNTNSNLKYARAPDEYFYYVYGTPFDSNSDGFSDAIQVNMDVDTTYGGALNVFVYAYLRDQLDNYVAFDDPLWPINATAVEEGEALLYLPTDAQEGYYDVELFLFDSDYNYEDYRLFEDEVYLYPSQIGWLQGTVKDDDTGLPMSTVDIYVNGTYEASTNATGQYSLELLAGDYEITAEEWEGSLYDPQTIDVSIVGSVITTQDFYLERTNWILSIQTDGSGDTEPSSGMYTWPKNTEFPVEALPDPGFKLLYWLLDSVDVGSDNPFPVFMDSNHNLTAVFIEYSTTASVESCNSAGDQKDYFDLGETVYITGNGYSPSTTYNLYVVADTDWSDSMSIPTRISGTANNITSNTEGAIPSTAIWSDPQTIGKYDIVVDVNDNGVYDVGVDALDSSDVEVTAGLVVPEFSPFLFLTFFIMLTLFAIFTSKDHNKKGKKTQVGIFL